MKRVLAAVLCGLLLVGMTGCGNKNKETRGLLRDVALGNVPYIDEAGDSHRVKNGRVISSILLDYAFEPAQYVFIDMDGDGEDELVVSEKGQNHYWLLHREENKVYGYFFNIRTLAELRADGRFQPSSGVGKLVISRIASFNGVKWVQENLLDVALDQIYVTGQDAPNDAKVYYDEFKATEPVKWTDYSKL